jgi:two-component system response regulator
MNEKVVLLVENNPDDVVLMLRAFKQNNILNKVVVARDGVEALEYMVGDDLNEGGTLESSPVLVLLDLKMPRIDGFEVLKKIRETERTRIVPVVILTSSLEDADIIKSYRLGANGYMHKPVDYKNFVEAVKQIGLYWLVWNEPPPAQNTCHAGCKT